jgi:hypothetical protein
MGPATPSARIFRLPYQWGLQLHLRIGSQRIEQVAMAGVLRGTQQRDPCGRPFWQLNQEVPIFFGNHASDQMIS